MKKRWLIIGGGLLVYAIAMQFGDSTPVDEATTSSDASGPADEVGSPAVAFSGPRFLKTSKDRVTLDYATGEMVIRTRMSAPPGERPARVWVWAFFVNPDEAIGGSRSDQPIEVAVDFKGSDTLTVEARGPFHWSTRDDIPRGPRVFARVFVSAMSSDSAIQKASERNRSVATMTRVDVR